MPCCTVIFRELQNMLGISDICVVVEREEREEMKERGAEWRAQ